MRVVCVLLIASVGCYSWRTIPKEEIPSRIEAGDKVRVTTKTGEQTVFHVRMISPHSVAGEGVSFVLDEIEKLELRRFSFLKTGLAAGGYVALIIAVSAIATAALIAAW